MTYWNVPNLRLSGHGLAELCNLKRSHSTLKTLNILAWHCLHTISKILANGVGCVCQWLPESSFVVFRYHPLFAQKPHAYVERIQPSGFCYMHAPVVLQHYLVSTHSDLPVSMLDMAVYLRKFLSSTALEDRISKDYGGDPKEFLESI
jgi:hypothetical protein